MNTQELKKILCANKVPSRLYNLEGKGRNDERFCLENKGDKWSVYFAERGIKTINKMFDTEDEACKYIYKELLD